MSLKGEVGVLATALAGKILGSKLENDDVQSSMIDQMIAELGQRQEVIENLQEREVTNARRSIAYRRPRFA